MVGWLIQITSSPNTTTLFTGHKKKILSVERAGQQSPSAFDLTLNHFGAASAAKHLPSSALRMMKWDDPGVTEWSSSWWPCWGRHPRALGRHACLSASRRRRPGGEAVDKTGGVSSVRLDSPNEYLSITQQADYLGLCWKTNSEMHTWNFAATRHVHCKVMIHLLIAMLKSKTLEKYVPLLCPNNQWLT